MGVLSGAAFYVLSQGLRPWKRQERTICTRFLQALPGSGGTFPLARIQAHATPNNNKCNLVMDFGECIVILPNGRISFLTSMVTDG